MSRRARRKQGAGKNPWVGKFVVVIGVLLLIAVGIGYAGLRAYLHSESFRKFLSAEVSRAGKVEGSFAPFRWDGLAVETAGFDATGEGYVATVDADQIDTEVGFGGLGRGVWEIKDTRINRVEIALNAAKKDDTPPIEPELHKKEVMKKQPGWVPSEVELESLEIGELKLSGNLPAGPIKATGMSLKVRPASGKKAYQGEIRGGTVNLPRDWLPQLRINRIAGTYHDGSAFINKADFSAWREGRINGFGEWNSGVGFYSFEGEVDGVKCDELLNETWARRLTGEASSSFAVDDRSGDMVMRGDLVIRNGTMTALPMLDALAAYADTRRFRILNLSDAKTTWRYSNGEILLTDLIIASEGLIRLEGTLAIKEGGLDGRFRLGIVPGVLSQIPGAETDVFQPGELGLLWAPVHVTGTLEDPKEDLTDRLIAAAGMRMFEQLPETGEKVYKYTRSMLGESPSRVVDEGIKIIDKGNKVIEGAGGILEGILGR